MKLRSLSRRFLLIVLAAVVTGLVTPTVLDVLVATRRKLGLVVCGTADRGSLVCQTLQNFPVISAIITLVATIAVLVTGCYWATRWALGPVRQIVVPIAQVGPQNLGYRINGGRGRDVLAVLARSIDDMMDRITTGYEAQRHFAANASHELRTPLAVQRTLIEVSLARATTPEKLELLTAQLLATNERNERLIEGLLVLSESDRGLLSRAPLRLDEIVAGVLADHQVWLREHGLTVSTRLDRRIVLGERVLLERLVTNLVQNAIKYNRPGGAIEVEVGDEPALAVSNTGDDVPPDAVAGLFEPFRRLAGTRIDHSGGAGLGLAIARSITQAHTGTIFAKSTGRDGLRVEISLPTVRQ